VVKRSLMSLVVLKAELGFRKRFSFAVGNRTKPLLSLTSLCDRQLPVLLERGVLSIQGEIGPVGQRRIFEGTRDFPRQDRLPEHRQGSILDNPLNVTVMKGLVPPLPQRCRNDVDEPLTYAESPKKKLHAPTVSRRKILGTGPGSERQFETGRVGEPQL